MVGKPISNRIISLPPYHFIHYSLRTEEATSASLDIEGTRPHLKETRIKNPKGD